MKNNLLFSSGTLSIGGQRAGYRVWRTRAGIAVAYTSLYSGEGYTRYYRDWDYPELPADWSTPLNDWGTTDGELWLRDLRDCRAYRTIHHT